MMLHSLQRWWWPITFPLPSMIASEYVPLLCLHDRGGVANVHPLPAAPMGQTTGKCRRLPPLAANVGISFTYLSEEVVKYPT